MKYWYLYIILFYFPAQGQGTLGPSISFKNQKKINSELSEFSPVVWKDYIVFVSNNNKYSESEYFNLYVSGISRNDQLEKSALLSRVLSSDFHEGPCAFNNNGNQIFFTRVDLQDNQLNPDEDATVKLKIYESNFNNGEWSTPYKSKINIQGISSCHPTISKNGEILIFASDRPGGYGKMDLYLSEKINGKWSTPINLGPEINSSGNDWFPSLDDKGHLFYSSDAEQGQLDIFLAKLEGVVVLEKMKLPEPFNTAFDDFGLILLADQKHGFLSSNRPGGKGLDDIYAFSLEDSIEDLFIPLNKTIKLALMSQNPDLNLDNTRIRFRSLSDTEVEIFDPSLFNIVRFQYDSLLVNSLEDYELLLDSEYTLVEVVGDHITPWQIVISKNTKEEKVEVNIKAQEIIAVVDTIEEETIIETDSIEVGSILVFDNIYYEYNSSMIEAGAAKELEALAEVMFENSKISVLLNAHTDSRGESDYNLWLSQRRAENAKKYLIQKGIDATRVSAIGMGETQIRNHCLDGVVCSEEEHVYNRRTEVVVLSK